MMRKIKIALIKEEIIFSLVSPDFFPKSGNDDTKAQEEQVICCTLNNTYSKEIKTRRENVSNMDWRKKGLGYGPHKAR